VAYLSLRYRFVSAYGNERDGGEEGE
jgi:hypothetical protein